MGANFPEWILIRLKNVSSGFPVKEYSPRSVSFAYARRQRVKMKVFVMPAWMAGIQCSQDGSGDIHVNLDSSAPCWNDNREVLLQVTGAPPVSIFTGGRHEKK